MKKDDLIRRMENLSKEYNELSSQLMTLDAQGTRQNSQQQLPSTSHNVSQCEATVEKLKTENGQCKKEIQFLKDHLKRCNQQLNRYIHKHGEISHTYSSYTPHEDSKSAITRQSVYKLNALLLAYDEVINEQESTIQRMTLSMEDSLKKMKILEEENKRFQKFYKVFGGEESYGEGELRQVAEDAKLLMEGRELLLEEIDLLHEKEVQMKEHYDKRIETLEVNLHQEKSLSSSLKEKLKKDQADLDHLHEQYKRLQEELKKSVAEEQHKKSIGECSKYLEKLKEAYGSESSMMKKNVRAIRDEKNSLEDRLNKSSEKVQGMKKAVTGYRTHLRRSYSQLSYQGNLIRSLKLSRRSFQTKLRNLSRICSKLLEDRKHLLQEMHDLRKESRRYSHEATSKSANLGKLTIKFKEERLQLVQRLAEAEGKRRAAEAAWDNSMKDVARLRKLLRSKDDSLQAVLSDLRFGLTRKPPNLSEDFR